MKRTITALIALSFLFVAGCGGETEANVKDDDRAASVVESDDGETDEPAEDESEQPDAQKETAPLGSTVELGTWEVRVTKVTLNADASIRKANQFNEKPKGHYMLVEYTAKYVGDERTADVDSDLTWTFTGGDAQVYETASVVSPADNGDVPTSARKGGTVKQQVVFDLSKKVLDGGVVTVEAYDEDYDTVYADFAIR